MGLSSDDVRELAQQLEHTAATFAQQESVCVFNLVDECQVGRVVWDSATDRSFPKHSRQHNAMTLVLFCHCVFVLCPCRSSCASTMRRPRQPRQLQQPQKQPLLLATALMVLVARAAGSLSR